jgi:excinuclease ABC subunit B
LKIESARCSYEVDPKGEPSPKSECKLRLSATSSLLSRRDVIVVASVSCIYGLGSPEDYFEMMAMVTVGAPMQRDDLLRKFVDMQYERNDIAFQRGTFRVRRFAN